MDFIKNNFESFSLALSVVVSLYVFWRTPKYKMLQERYKNIIFPLFSLLEPYLYVPYDTIPIDKVTELIESNQMYLGSRLHECLYYFKRNPSQENYNAFCNRLCHEYDMCCFFFGLKVRSISYRINRNQYSSVLFFIFYLIGNTLLLLFAFIVFLFVLTSVFFISQKILGL